MGITPTPCSSNPTAARGATADAWPALLDAAAAARSAEWTSVPSHRPTAAVLTCADARLAPSLIFDQAPGSLFTVRVAGNTLTPAAQASLDYAVGELGVDLVIVLGHTSCGAVAAALDGACCGGVAAITSPICRLAADHPGASADEVSALNVDATAADLRASDGPAGQAIRAGRTRVVGALFDLATGQVDPIEISSDTPHHLKEPV